MNWRITKSFTVGRLNRYDIKRILEKVNFEENGCWEFTGKDINKDGYANVRYNKKSVRLHRLMYAWVCGTIPENTLVLHSCHNPRCCCPDHLRLGTHQENMADMIEAGHSLKGELRHNSILKETDMPEIVELYNSGETIQSIANKFNVGRETIGGLAKRLTWTHLPLNFDGDKRRRAKLDRRVKKPITVKEKRVKVYKERERRIEKEKPFFMGTSEEIEMMKDMLIKGISWKDTSKAFGLSITFAQKAIWDYEASKYEKYEYLKPP